MVVEALAHTYDFVVFATSSASEAKRVGPMCDAILVRDADPAAHALVDELSHVCADVSLIEDAKEELVAV